MHLQTCFVPPMAFVWLISRSRQRGLLLLAGAQGGACWLKEPMSISNILLLSAGNTGCIPVTCSIVISYNTRVQGVEGGESPHLSLSKILSFLQTSIFHLKKILVSSRGPIYCKDGNIVFQSLEKRRSLYKSKQYTTQFHLNNIHS